MKENFFKEIEQSNAKSTVDSIRLPMLLNFPVCTCDYDLQQRIADFLDAKCAHIDDAIAKEKELIEKLKEYRQSVITEAVTKGLNPSAPMKDSGIDWIGQIPKHWKTSKLKHVFPKLLSGVSVNSTTGSACEKSLGIMKTSCVYQNTFIASENKKVIESDISRVACPVLKNSLIISRMNTPELVGNCGYVAQDYTNLFLPDRLWQATFQTKAKLLGKFAWYYCSSDEVQAYTFWLYGRDKFCLVKVEDICEADVRNK